MDFFIKNSNFNLQKTLFCGQAFRWRDEGGGIYSGISGARRLKIRQEADGVTFLGVNERDIPYWHGYFDVGTDYSELEARFSEDETLKKACEYAHGLRVLRQEPFETLISFIISQNNNIARISGIIGRLCEAFGEPLGSEYAFPRANVLAGLSVEDLAPVRAGFRAKYILDAATKVHTGELELERLYELSAEEAKQELLRIKGVGDKVADCVLLFAYRKTELVPKDVWIKRVLAEFYPGGLPKCVGENAGIAQQYLFDYIRNNKDIIKQEDFV